DGGQRDERRLGDGRRLVALDDLAEDVALPGGERLEGRLATVGGPPVGVEVGEQLGPYGDRRHRLAGGRPLDLVQDAADPVGLAGEAGVDERHLEGLDQQEVVVDQEQPGAVRRHLGFGTGECERHSASSAVESGRAGRRTAKRARPAVDHRSAPCSARSRAATKRSTPSSSAFDPLLKNSTRISSQFPTNRGRRSTPDASTERMTAPPLSSPWTCTAVVPLRPAMAASVRRTAATSAARPTAVSPAGTSAVRLRPARRSAWATARTT